MNEHMRTYIRMRQARRIAERHLFRGEWMTAQQIAEATGIKVRTVHRRIQFGLPIEGPARFGPLPRQFAFRGQLATIAEIMDATGLSRSQVSKRTDGIRFFERHELKDPNAPLPDNARVLFFRGIKDSVCGWARRTGIAQSVIRARLDIMGWTLERALIVPSKAGTADTITFRGRTMTVSAWAKEAGISRATLRTRLLAGWSVKRALTEPALPASQRALYRRNAKIIARMTEAFHHPSTSAPTGGWSETFPKSAGTGVGSHEIHCEGTLA
jgi:hypothetical protein